MRELNSKTAPKTVRPERIIQFGEGNFLRAFVDWIISNMNERSDFNGSVVVVQPIEKGMVDVLNRQDGLYHVNLQGLENGQVVNSYRLIDVISRALNPYSHFDEYMKLAEQPEFRFVVSNTTEAGIAFDPACRLDDRPAASYPGKLTQLLYHRFRHFHGDKSKGLIIFPCELIFQNGHHLKRIIRQYIDLWQLGEDFATWFECAGLGYKMEFDPELLIPDTSLSLSEGAISCMGWQSSSDKGSFTYALLDALAKEYGFSLDTPFRDLPDDIRHMLIYGKSKSVKVHYKGQRGVGVYDVVFDGLIDNMRKRYRETASDMMKQEYETYMQVTPCDECHGQRLKKSSLAVTVGDKNIYQVTELSVLELAEYFDKLTLTPVQEKIGKQVIKEIRSRVGFLNKVGLDYLTLARATGTLSGGEAQRIRLSTQIGSGLMGVAYILDEPSIGLHQRDNDKLLNALKSLRDLGNTLIVVEHDEDTMYAADYIVDIGPAAGEHGGEVVAAGTVQDIINNPNSITGAYLSGRIKIPVPEIRRTPKDWIKIKGAKQNNLKNINVDIPLGVFTCVTGVSGSGKSSLVNEILYKRLARDLNRARCIPGEHKDIIGIEKLDKVINIDQSPIGRTPRSNPATYTGVFDMIRDLFASTAEAKAKGYSKGRFSFNVKGGRCEACSGDGIIKIEMHFLPDVYVPCEVCDGKRYNRETLEVKYKGKSIYDVLNMTVEEAVKFFENVPSIRNKIQTLYDVGLSYIRLGQPSTELSGGEAQRIKLATELSKRSTGRTIYILDEPTTGLHFADVHKLVEILHKLADAGNTVVVIEHNLDVIKTADYIIDIGPEGGFRGGTVVAKGTPEQVAKIPESYTGQYIKKYL